MLQSHTLRAADFCGGSNCQTDHEKGEYRRIKKAAWVHEHDNFLRRIKYDEIDETSDGHCGFRVTARILCLSGIIVGGPLEATARAMTPEII